MIKKNSIQIVISEIEVERKSFGRIFLLCFAKLQYNFRYMMRKAKSAIWLKVFEKNKEKQNISH